MKASDIVAPCADSIPLNFLWPRFPPWPPPPFSIENAPGTLLQSAVACVIEPASSGLLKLSSRIGVSPSRQTQHGSPISSPFDSPSPSESAVQTSRVQALPWRWKSLPRAVREAPSLQCLWPKARQPREDIAAPLGKR
eukprot:CAMPEP_0184727676 /NCGR_PEP_ID=MMETSP0314-20130426/37162_1 /TAXON_ID=38298 /ORGANISM="Rhodella maculata, Strain CCMP 736" /LENGTH=137 /DNA_ID=CAMNT_0027193323 /DNA_START=72 /DNA_END=481 /DNA_ORIENTATION=+